MVASEIVVSGLLVCLSNRGQRRISPTHAVAIFCTELSNNKIQENIIMFFFLENVDQRHFSPTHAVTMFLYQDFLLQNTKI